MIELEACNFNFRHTGVVAPPGVTRPGQVLLVASSSFEARCTHVVDNLASDYQADVFLLCDYRGDYEYVDVQQANLLKLQQRAQKRVSIVKTQTLKIYDAKDSLTDVRNTLTQIAQGYKITHVDFDVTTFTKQYIMILLKLIDDLFSTASVRILYSPASQYLTHGGSTLTEHVRDIVSVPGFDRFTDSKERFWVLVLFLGFEEHRALSLVDRLDPKVCIPVLQSRKNAHLGSSAPAEYNRQLLELVKARYGQMPLFVDREDPKETLKFLQAIYEEWVENSGGVVLVAPHGSKMQAVGTYLFLRLAQAPQYVGAVYALPQTYRALTYSGRPMGYIVEFTWQPFSSMKTSVDRMGAASLSPLLVHG